MFGSLCAPIGSMADSVWVGAAADVQHVQDVHNDDCSFTAAAWAGQFPYLYTGGASQKVYVCQLVPALTQHV